MDIPVDTVKRLINEQFPQWRELPVYPVAKSGHDNRTFHLGDAMAVRLPSGENYAGQAAKEIRWLPFLQEQLDYPIPKPIAAGKPTAYYPFPWSVNQWVVGDVLLDCPDLDKKRLAEDLAKALKQLQAADGHGGPQAGPHNFYRGGDLTVYHRETMDALEALQDSLPVKRLQKIWEASISRAYTGPDVWVHGDVAPGNILIQAKRFCGLIDFGILGMGDPACDYAMAWTYFDEQSSTIFLAGLPKDMVDRARGWALWKALITFCDSHPDVKENAGYTIRAILNEKAE